MNTLISNKHLRFKYINVFEDANSIAVRVLTPVVDSAENAVCMQLMCTSPMLNKAVKLDVGDVDNVFCVVAEGFFDKNSSIGQQWWRLGESVDFFYDVTDINKGKIQCAPLLRLVEHTQESKTQYLARHGKQHLMTVWCLDEKSSLKDSRHVISYDEQGLIYTNLDLTSFNSVATNDDINHSNLQIKLLRSSCVNPNQMLQIGVVSSTKCSGTLYVNATSGFLPKKKVTLTEGQGHFSISSLMLLPNEQLTFSIGTEFSPLLETSIPVV